MPTPVLVIFYAWLIVSLVGLGYRFATRRRRASAAPPAAARPVRTEWAPPAPAGAGTDAPPTAPAPAPAGGSRRGPAGTPSTSLLEALAGISLPCDLVPLTSVEGRDLAGADGAGRDLLLITTGHRPQEVGRAMGAAVAALGYAVTPNGAHEAVAARGADRITMIVHDRPDTVLVGKHRAFPTATEGDVVVELRL